MANTNLTQRNTEKLDRGETIPSRKEAMVARDLGNSIGFVCEEADRLYQLGNGKTALFWHLVGIVQSHIREDEK